MVKKLLLILPLLFCVGCSNGVKKVKVENFDYQKTKLVSYLDDAVNQTIDKRYNVVNNHFRYVADVDGQCSMFNKVSELGSERTYVMSTSNAQGSLNVELYLKQDSACRKVQTLNNIAALSNKQVSYHNRIYLNVLSNEDINRKSGLWVLDVKNKKLISNLKSLSADFDIDPLTGILYAIEYTCNGMSYIRAYNQSDKMINQYPIKDENYSKLFIKDGQLSLVSQKKIGEQNGDVLFNYVITKFSLHNLFNDLNTKNHQDIVEIEAHNSDFNTMKIKNDYMVFYGDSSVVCKTNYSKCLKYENDIVELFDGQGYIGINGGSRDDEGMYLNKFDTNGVEKLLNYAQSYLTSQDGKDIYFQVFDRDDETKTKTIKYTIK